MKLLSLLFFFIFEAVSSNLECDEWLIYFHSRLLFYVFYNLLLGNSLEVLNLKIFKEEVRDLLDSVSVNKSLIANGNSGKITVPGRSPIQIRESSNGVITLAGSTEVSVNTLQEMAACLEQGSLSRATGSTNMNNQSR